jgi:hypothetical protein
MMVADALKSRYRDDTYFKFCVCGYPLTYPASATWERFFAHNLEKVLWHTFSRSPVVMNSVLSV